LAIVEPVSDTAHQPGHIPNHYNMHVISLSAPRAHVQCRSDHRLVPLSCGI